MPRKFSYQLPGGPPHQEDFDAFMEKLLTQLNCPICGQPFAIHAEMREVQYHPTKYWSYPMTLHIHCENPDCAMKGIG
jgi:hypothetical protein